MSKNEWSFISQIDLVSRILNHSLTHYEIYGFVSFPLAVYRHNLIIHGAMATRKCNVII